MAEHLIKVVPPYFEALLDGSKTFEVRKNDRAYQRGDRLRLAEWGGLCSKRGCNTQHDARFTGREVVVEVTFVYSGDPRFGGIEPGHVVLGFAQATPEDPKHATPRP